LEPYTHPAAQTRAKSKLTLNRMGSLRYLSRWSEMKFGLAVPLGAGVKNEAFNKISQVSDCFFEYEYKYEHKYK
jgi:hypothetical protein